jgi:putative membrane protein insertion efficiency factor
MKTTDLRESPRYADAETNHTGPGARVSCVLILLLAGIAFHLSNPAASSFGSDFMMKGPVTELRALDREDSLETSSAHVALLGLIRMYQRFVSPVGGVDRCGFRPSCSRYGYQAIKEQGPLMGIVMIGDRQTRCNIFKEPGPDYPLLPNGKLYDPVSNNLLFEK